MGENNSPGRPSRWLERLNEEKTVTDNENEEMEIDSPDPEATALSESVPIQTETEAEASKSTPSESIRSKTGRYSLRSHTQSPGCFM
jgi:hypothetical protein